MAEMDEFTKAFQAIWQNGTPPTQCPPIRSLSLDEAYDIQQAVIAWRVDLGERAVGYKVGCTSKAIRQQFGLSEPIFGRLMKPHVHHGDTTLPWDDFIQCAIEPEFVFCMKWDVKTEMTDEKELVAAIDWVAPGIEVHNYNFWFGEASSQELIASNGIHAALVVGDQRFDPTSVDFDIEGVGVFRNDELVESGIGAEIMGGPLRSLRWLVENLIRHDEYLRAGDLVIPGSPVGLVPVRRNDRITATFTSLGPVTADFS